METKLKNLARYIVSVSDKTRPKKGTDGNREEDAYDEEVLGIAVWAMKKQIPIRPIEEDKEFRCGMCNTSVAKQDGYCWKCGQKQEWEG